MATVPTYGAPKVAATPLPGVRKTAAATPESLGAGLAIAKARTAETLGEAGGQVSRMGQQLYSTIVERERTRANNVAKLEFAKQIGQWEIDKIHNEQTGALTVRGKDAQGVPEQVLDEFDKFVGALAPSAATDEQKFALEALAVERRAHMELTLRKHVAGEMEAWEKNTLNGLIENVRDLAAANALDPRRVSLELQRGEQALRDAAPDLRMGTEAVDAAVKSLRQDVYQVVIGRMVANGMTKEAGILFEELSAAGDLDKDAVAQLETKVKGGQQLTRAQEAADEIVRAGGTLQQQRDAVKAKLTGEERTTAMQLVEHEWNVRKGQEREANEGRLKAIYNVLDQGGGLRAVMRREEWTDLDPNERSAIRSYADNLARGIAVKTDTETLYALISRYGTDPEGFAEENLLRYKHLLSQDHLASLGRVQSEIRQGQRASDIAADKVLKGPMTALQLTNETLQSYGFDPDPKPSTPEAKAIAQFRGVVDQRVEAMGGYDNLKNEDVRAIIDALVLESTNITRPSTWGGMLFNSEGWRSSKPIRVIEIDTINEVPRDDREKIRASWKARGISADDALIISTYRDWLWNKK